MRRIHICASDGDLAAVIEQLESGVDIKNNDNALGQTALHKAAWNGRPNVVRELLDRKADIFQLDNSEETALYITANGIIDVSADIQRLADYYQVFRLLLDHEAQLRQQNPALFSHVPLLRESTGVLNHHPIKRLNAHAELQKQLLRIILRIESQYNINPRMIFDYVKQGEVLLVQRLLEIGADPNIHDEILNESLLSKAARNGRANVAKILLATSKTDIYETSLNGATA